MTRGNQREIDRQRAANRHAGKGEAKEGDHLKRSSISEPQYLNHSTFWTKKIDYEYYWLFIFRKENDAKALAEKVARKKEMEEAAARFDWLHFLIIQCVIFIICRGEVMVSDARGPGGAVKKKDGSKKKWNVSRATRGVINFSFYFLWLHPVSVVAIYAQRFCQYFTFDAKFCRCLSRGMWSHPFMSRLHFSSHFYLIIS